MKADLHIHSNYSDGSEKIEDLFEKIKSSDVNIFALTDHDTIAGCDEMAQIVPNEYKFIKGVELTSICDKIKCHLLGYKIDTKNKELNELIQKGKILRAKKLETRINYLKDVWNIELNDEEKAWLYSRKSVVKTHVANILVKRGLANNNLEAMEKYLDGCKTGNTRFLGEESVSVIKNAGGIVVWAHPLGGEGEEHLKKEEFIPKLESMLEFGIQGLECFYSRYNEEESKFLVECAKKYDLLISGGSDYHGKNKSNIEIGKLDCNNKSINAEFLTILNEF